MRPDATVVIYSFLLQAGIALVVAVVLSWLWRERSLAYLRPVVISWWCLVAYLSAAGIGFDFSARHVASAMWTAAVFVAETTVILHVLFVVAGVRLMLRQSVPSERTQWLIVAAAVGYGALSALGPEPGPDGAYLRMLLRGTLPPMLLAGTYLSLAPGIWRARHDNEYGAPLLAAAFGFTAAIYGLQGWVWLETVLPHVRWPGMPPWYPLSVIGQAMLGLGWIGVLLEADQHERLEAAERANRADKMLHDALDASVDLIGLVDQQERLVLCNTRMARTIEDLTGHAPTPLMPYPRPGRTDDERAQFFSTIQRALRGEHVHERSEMFSVRSGERLVLDRYIVPIREHGAVTGAFVVARDVTQDDALRQEAERAMRIEAMARMAGGLAHDFNNILTVVQTNLQLLAESCTHNDESAEIFMETAGALDRANQLTRRLLGIARERPASATRFDVSGLLCGFAGFLQHAVGEEVVLSIDTITDETPVVMDVGRLEQVLLNLSLNGRDAMPHGGTLRISVRRDTLDGAGASASRVPPGRYVVIAVADEGVGMDEATRARAGDPFFTTKHASSGSGLGLATCRALITEATGALRIDSALGRGTTVTIHLPEAVPSAGPGARGT